MFNFIKEPITNDFDLNVSLGRYDNKIIKFSKFAKSLTAGTVTTDVWTRDHNLTYATSAETLYIWSDDAADTIDAIVIGLDSDGYYQEAEVTLNGSTPVQIPFTWLRVFRVRPNNGTINEGQWFISTSNAGGTPADNTIRAHVTAGESGACGTTFMSHFTIPKGYIGLVKAYTTIQPGSADITFTAFSREQGKTFVPLDIIGDTITRDMHFAFFPELSDLKVMAHATATVNRDIPLTYIIYLVDKRLYNTDGARIFGKADFEV